ncbi:hypothetical protein [Thiocapsa marina]|uniref:Uncharacterized protein n=1 Tax=Thiocapsa marina 5811 TaxID=768671 RepID=F9U5M8_9GAMM|nr:hypothetical protein [Thiocapsa marina]EGV20451.1 hypothetical protein ThimaDRAFT_0229 [Thiocapsa marina 5811]
MYDAYDLLEADAFDDWDAGLDFDVFDEDDLFEDDEFLGSAWGWLTRPGSVQRRVALNAARGAIQGTGTAAGTAIGLGLGGPGGALAGGILGNTVGGGLSGLLPDQMDQFAALAAEAEDEAEAEAFLGALVPLAARLIPQAGQAIMRVAPQLIRGLAGTAQAVHANPAARQLLRTAGTVVRKTGADIARQVAQGRPVTGQTAVRQLARNTYRTMADPRQVRRAAARAARPTRGMRRRCVRWAYQ